MPNKITPPPGAQVWEGEIATYWFDKGILVSRSKDPKRTVDNLAANVELVKEITGNKKVPLLIYLSTSSVPDAKARKFAAEQLPHIYSAMAMVAKPGLAQFIMNVLFKFRTPPLPMKNFTNDTEAREWLKQFVQEQ